MNPRFILQSLFSLLILCFPLAHLWATTPTTISIDGTVDFEADEDVSGTSGSIWYFTWDANYFYVGLDANDVDDNDNAKWLHLYLDTDPTTPATSGSGTTLGVNYTTQEPVLPFSANYHFRWRTSNNFTELMEYNGTNWAQLGVNVGVAAFQAGTFVEIRLDRAEIGNPSVIRVAGSMINQASGVESTFFMAPSGNSEGYDTDYTDFFTFPLISGISPDDPIYVNAALPTLPVSWLSIDAQSTTPGEAILSWATSGEQQNRGFTPQLRSETTPNFVDAGWVEAGKAPQDIQQYDWRFTDLEPGRYQFRVKQTDLDGGISFSPLVELQIRNFSSHLWREGNALHISVDLVEDQPMSFFLYDLKGSLMYQQQKGILPKGRQELEMHMQLPSGLYYYELRIGGQAIRERFRW